MHEDAKLEEAKFFYSLMTSTQTKGNDFRYMLSAFLNASRSVLLYALKEIKQNPLSLAWYNSYVPTHPPLGFFKDKRDVNIHEKPIGLNVHVILTASIGLSASVTVVHRDKDGNIIGQRTVSDSNPSAQPSRPIPPKVQFFFDDWTGNEDVLALSQMYLSELDKFVQEAKSKGYITV
jgi:hypothetical protein